MEINIREFRKKDLPEMINIWNFIVGEGNAFPQEDFLDGISGEKFFKSQTYCAVAENAETGEIAGLYILHPNNVGRCGHICNASYAVKHTLRGQHIGEKLVLDCMKHGKIKGFKILQFNAVVKTNYSALHLYKKLGFISLGTIPKGFLTKDGTYEDIIPHYHEL